ncbi:DUF2516 family protein [Corynebacterium ulceribovis]|uniref:DUF2516 family protein n=1 Tax=Corynebacterium ulceribovis TaxID=487732 RepID=UPI000370D193|nr:DUF2516 family protein [Corynebacterium ulceribovis]
MSIIQFAMTGPVYLEFVLTLMVALLGLIGAVMAAATRPDAYDVADRMSKWAWTGVLAGFGIGIPLLGQISLMIPIIGAVFIGLWWTDVRPQIRDILDGTGGL